MNQKPSNKPLAAILAALAATAPCGASARSFRQGLPGSARGKLTGHMKLILLAAVLSASLSRTAAAQNRIDWENGAPMLPSRERLAELPVPPLAQADPASAKACYCETGRYPENEVGFFRTGCALWLNGQDDCSVKEIVSYRADYARMPVPAGTTELSIGYVGHWSSSSQFVEYLRRVILPVMKEKNYSVSVDNTACRAMKDPEEVLSFIRGLALGVGQRLEVKGNQVVSVGKWDALLGSRVNFSAKVSSRENQVSYPACRKHENYNCIQQVQLGETGKCVDEESRLSELVCCRVVDEYTETTREKYVWSKHGQCSRDR